MAERNTCISHHDLIIAFLQFFNRSFAALGSLVVILPKL